MKKGLRYKIFFALWGISLCIVFFKSIQYYFDSKASREVRKELNITYDKVKYEQPKVQEKTKIQKLKELQKTNKDIVALIEIKGTNINYPVVQTTNNSYYMTHNYKKEKSKEGAIFLDKDYNWEKPSKNLLIYGHNNVGSAEMFSDLIKYKNKSFYEQHKTINFITNEQEEQFEIISVFLSRVYYKKEKNVFRYYYFINANNEKEFNDYISNVKKISLYNIKTTAEYADQLMTLSTCDYSKNNGRIAVVARKILSD